MATMLAEEDVDNQTIADALGQALRDGRALFPTRESHDQTTGVVHKLDVSEKDDWHENCQTCMKKCQTRLSAGPMKRRKAI